MMDSKIDKNTGSLGFYSRYKLNVKFIEPSVCVY